MHSLLSLFQFTDGLFPAGAYAHSFGLETYTQAGSDANPGAAAIQIVDAAGVEQFLRAYLEGSAAPTDAVALLCAWRAAQAGDLASCIDLDETLDAIKTASELREASRQMGRQTLRVANHFPCDPLLTAFGVAVAGDVTPGHHPVIFGMIGAAMKWPSLEMTSAYLYSTSAALVGAALRLIPLGQLAGQRILWNIRPLIARLAEGAQGKAQEDMWSFASALEIASMRHALLEARLFRS
jgi:urease accessory protein